MMYTDETLRQLCVQEDELVFDRFDERDAWDVGRLLIEAVRREPKPIAMQAVLDGFPVFRYFLPGTGPNNAFWMDKKYNTVHRTGTSSLRAAVELELSGLPPAPWQRDEERYALCGGGFPIRVRGRGVVGAYCISGLPHLDDHRVLTATLARHLGLDPGALAVDAP